MFLTFAISDAYSFVVEGDTTSSELAVMILSLFEDFTLFMISLLSMCSSLLPLWMALVGFETWSARETDVSTAFLLLLQSMSSPPSNCKALLRTSAMMVVDHRARKMVIAIWVHSDLQGMQILAFVFPLVSSQAPQSTPWYPWYHKCNLTPCYMIQIRYVLQINSINGQTDRFIYFCRGTPYIHVWSGNAVL